VFGVLFLFPFSFLLFAVIPQWGWIMILSPGLVLLSWIRDTSNLKYTSFLGVLLLSGAMGCVLVYGFLNLPPPDVIASQINHAPVDFFVFFGTSVYVFEGINMAIPIHREMRHPDSFRLMFAFVSFGLFLGFGTFALCGYIFFLDNVQDIIIKNLAPDWRLAVSIMVMLELILSFPVVFFPISWAVERNMAPRLFSPPESPVFTCKVIVYYCYFFFYSFYFCFYSSDRVADQHYAGGDGAGDSALCDAHSRGVTGSGAGGIVCQFFVRNHFADFILCDHLLEGIASHFQNHQHLHYHRWYRRHDHHLHLCYCPHRQRGRWKCEIIKRDF
jgi:hypothetical protein